MAAFHPEPYKVNLLLCIFMAYHSVRIDHSDHCMLKSTATVQKSCGWGSGANELWDFAFWIPDGAGRWLHLLPSRIDSSFPSPTFRKPVFCWIYSFLSVDIQSFKFQYLLLCWTERTPWNKCLLLENAFYVLEKRAAPVSFHKVLSQGRWIRDLERKLTSARRLAKGLL